MSSSKHIFKFKPEIEENIIITHPDLTGKAEHNFEVRKEIFDKKYSSQILNGKMIHYSNYNYKLKEKRKQILQEEEALELEKLSINNWLADDEEKALFIEHYVQEIRLEVDKKRTMRTMGKRPFFLNIF